MKDLIIKWAVPFLCGAAVSFVISMFVKLKSIKNGIQCLLRQKIIEYYDRYSEKGYCPIYIKESLSMAYKAYHALGGNDVATELYKAVMELPTEKGENSNGKN